MAYSLEAGDVNTTVEFVSPKAKAMDHPPLIRAPKPLNRWC